MRLKISEAGRMLIREQRRNILNERTGWLKRCDCACDRKEYLVSLVRRISSSRGRESLARRSRNYNQRRPWIWPESLDARLHCLRPTYRSFNCDGIWKIAPKGLQCSPGSIYCSRHVQTKLLCREREPAHT